MILLFEGPSLSGKTTLARKLAEDVKWPYIKFPSSVCPTSEGVWEFDDPRIDLLCRAISTCAGEIAQYFDFILDRCWLSNYVYSLFFSRSDSPEFYLEALRRLSPYLLVVCVTADAETLRDRFSALEETDLIYNAIFTRLEEQLELWESAVSHSRRAGVKVTKIDNSGDLEVAYGELIQFVRRNVPDEKIEPLLIGELI